MVTIITPEHTPVATSAVQWSPALHSFQSHLLSISLSPANIDLVYGAAATVQFLSSDENFSPEIV